MQDLLSSEDEGWTSITDWASASPRSVTVLPISQRHRDRCLIRLQVTTASVLGALAWHTGGVLLDHGWLRLLGGVSDAGLVDIATASGLGAGSAASQSPPFLVIAHDVLGGRFAVNGGGLPCEVGEVAYYGPDTLAWARLGMANRDFVHWTLLGNVADFYASLRWEGWEQEVEGLSADAGLSVHPPLFTREAQTNLAAASRRPVPWNELASFQEDMAGQLQSLSDGASFRLRVTPGDD